MNIYMKHSIYTYWRRKWQPTPVFLSEQSHGQRSWWATVHGAARVAHDLATKPPHSYIFANVYQKKKVLE